jgi:hypothetical protein
LLNKRNENLLCTFTFNKGVGGHYFSMLSLLDMEVFNGADILEIGYNKSPILSNLKSYKFINFSFFKCIWALRELKSTLLNRESINVFCFDVYSYSLIRMLLSKKSNNITITLVKCGGPNPSLYYPKTDNLICFSKENYDFFRKKSPTSLVSLIPNRVSREKLLASQDKVQVFEELIGLKILCIARIGNEYKNKFLLANELKNSILNLGDKCTLICIGSIDDSYVFSELYNTIETNVLWLTESKYTNSASNYINAVDIVIGTGRGAVESLFLNKVTFTPANNSSRLVNINDSNFSELVSNNFSGRTSITSSDETLSPLDLDKPSDSVVEKTIKMYSIESGTFKYETHIEKCRKTSVVTVLNNVTFLVYFTYSLLRDKNVLFSKAIYPCLKFLNEKMRSLSK